MYGPRLPWKMIIHSAFSKVSPGGAEARTACRQLFVEAEGVELMVLILKQRQQVRFGALKAVVGATPPPRLLCPTHRLAVVCPSVSVTAVRAAACNRTVHHGCGSATGAEPHHKARCAAQDFACTRCPQACERFVDVLGLKILFSIFMGKSKVRSTTQRLEVSGVLRMTQAFLSEPCADMHMQRCCGIYERGAVQHVL